MVISLSDGLKVVLFLIGTFGALYLWWIEAPTEVSVSLPRRDLPAYYQIQASDLSQKSIPASSLISTTLQTPAQIVGRYTLTDVPEKRPLNEQQLGPLIETPLISRTVPIGIPASPAMILGGNLQPGDMVDIMAVPAIIQKEPFAALFMFEDILVLDIKPAPTSQTSAGEHSSPFVIVLALPLDRRIEFVSRTANATLQITRQP